MTEDIIYVQSKISQVKQVARDSILANHRLMEDLGLGSMDVLEILCFAEMDLSASFSGSSLPKMVTVSDLATAISQARPGGGPISEA